VRGVDTAHQARAVAGAHQAPCRQCRHLAISHDPALPYWCRQIRIKTRVLPGVEVWRADGRDCQGFEPKPPASA
jgi:hypothetical protein